MNSLDSLNRSIGHLTLAQESFQKYGGFSLEVKVINNVETLQLKATWKRILDFSLALFISITKSDWLFDETDRTLKGESLKIQQLLKNDQEAVASKITELFSQKHTEAFLGTPLTPAPQDLLNRMTQITVTWNQAIPPRYLNKYFKKDYFICRNRFLSDSSQRLQNLVAGNIDYGLAIKLESDKEQKLRYKECLLKELVAIEWPAEVVEQLKKREHCSWLSEYYFKLEDPFSMGYEFISPLYRMLKEIKGEFTYYFRRNEIKPVMFAIYPLFEKIASILQEKNNPDIISKLNQFRVDYLVNLFGSVSRYENSDGELRPYLRKEIIFDIYTSLWRYGSRVHNNALADVCSLFLLNYHKVHGISLLEERMSTLTKEGAKEEFLTKFLSVDHPASHRKEILQLVYKAMQKFKLEALLEKPDGMTLLELFNDPETADFAISLKDSKR